MDTEELPLFPLHSVLFPGGQLTLRIFETRYLDLISECSHHGQGFGVCLILLGEEVGEPAVPAAIGCEARIIDFATATDGLLVVSVEGSRRFHVERSQVRDNGLIMAEVSWLNGTAAQAVQPEHQLLSLLLRRIVERAGPPHDRVDKVLFDDAEWVAWRLGEWLPVSWPDRQSLLQESDPHARLQRLVELIPNYQTF